MWRVARDSQTLDLNSSYAYLLWARDFAATSVVAERDGAVVGFVSGYVRPDSPETLMVWQVAVDDAFRGHGIAARMLHHLFDRGARRGVVAMHTTISPDNEASQRLFASVANARGLRFERRDLFAANAFRHPCLICVLFNDSVKRPWPVAPKTPDDSPKPDCKIGINGIGGQTG